MSTREESEGSKLTHTLGSNLRDEHKQHTLERIRASSVQENLTLIEDLKFFLATAPTSWQENQIIRRYYLNQEEGFVSCVIWNNLYFITGTDIVRCIVYRFELFGREIVDRKKFEEGIFSDLRSLKCGTDAILEPSKSPFLEFLYRNQCLRTQKKQKVFFWYSVMHDKLFADALERDMKKEQSGQAGTTKPVTEPALSFVYDDSRSLHDQLLEYVANKKVDEPVSYESPNKDDSTLDVTAPFNSSSPSNLDERPVGQTFIITEENNTPVVTPGRFDDDFPLDYFPQNNDQPILIDPSVFFNAPDEFDGQMLIDQTLARTPFQEVSFEANFDRFDEEDEDQEVVPVSYYPPHFTQGTLPPGIYHPQQLHYSHASHITNGQYYDSQATGEPLDIPSYPIDYVPVGPPPAFYGYSSHNHAQSPAVPQMLVVDPYGQRYENPYYPQFEGYEEGDDNEEAYEVYERQPYMKNRTQFPPSASPFGRFFPPFEATNPPSSKGLKFPRSVTKGNGRIAKPSTLRKTANAARVLRKLEKSHDKGTVKFKDLDNEKAAEDQKVEEHNRTEDEEEEEYTSLPTPESTVTHSNQNMTEYINESESM